MKLPAVAACALALASPIVAFAAPPTTAGAIVAASPVPASVQRAIPNKVPPHLRYLPTNVPLGYRYAKWHGTRSGLEIYFARKGRPPTLAFPRGRARRCPVRRRRVDGEQPQRA